MTLKISTIFYYNSNVLEAIDTCLGQPAPPINVFLNKFNVFFVFVLKSTRIFFASDFRFRVIFLIEKAAASELLNIASQFMNNFSFDSSATVYDFGGFWHRREYLTFAGFFSRSLRLVLLSDCSHVRSRAHWERDGNVSMKRCMKGKRELLHLLHVLVEKRINVSGNVCSSLPNRKLSGWAAIVNIQKWKTPWRALVFCSFQVHFPSDNSHHQSAL